MIKFKMFAWLFNLNEMAQVDMLFSQPIFYQPSLAFYEMIYLSFSLVNNFPTSFIKLQDLLDEKNRSKYIN